ncbi:MAG: bifunctional DNA-formamidopyrimidine glycosylase/DNA-(apurinic or apyrimidinic site) lyase [bacterium]
MPELPEVETTTKGLKKHVLGLKIIKVWTDLDTKDKRKNDTVANLSYFNLFKKEIAGRKILSVERRAKNILINVSGDKTILIHMKMTGHLLYGKYKFLKKENRWVPDKAGPLKDPYNRFVHVVFTLSNKKSLTFSDARKFGKITLIKTKETSTSKHLRGLGPEPLDKNFDFKKFKERLAQKPKGKIKSVLMDQSVISGIGNIYSDEILWLSGIHPERMVSKIKDREFKKIFISMKKSLSKGITLGGDSMSDYRNIHGLPGKFQLHHNVYRKTGEKCKKPKCSGIIKRIKVGGRSAHFCSVHQN